MEITIMRRKNTQKKSQFNFLLKEQDGTFKIDDWEIANNPEMILGRRNSDLVDDWLELFSDMPDSIADDQYVRVANNFLQKIGSRYRCVAKVSQNADGEITWKMTESSHKTLDNVRIHETTRKNMRRSGTKNLSEQSAPSMKKNILAENMKRFATKNLKEVARLDPRFEMELKDIYRKLQQGEFVTDEIIDEMGDFYKEVYESGDLKLIQLYDNLRSVAEDEPEDQFPPVVALLKYIDNSGKNLSEQSAPSMKKNILAENMKRFATKNLAEQNSRVQVKRIASDKLSGGEFEDNFVVNGKYKVEVYRASDGDFSATTAYFAGEDIMEDEFDTSIFGGVSNADVYDAILGFYEK
jgi:hypothetical protein